ncbi:MAG: hypothetical protein AAF366_02845 [Pseudomonadota bacterium]
MTPQIALDLSLDGIAVLSRVPDDHPDAGKWWREGTVRLDAPDLAGALARLRKLAEARAGADFTSILILPDSQLLYTSLERDDRRPKETIRSLLRGRTPYDVDDLTFDFIQRGDRLLVAVVALETLLEAETFAADHGFRPIAVIANPDRAIYPGLPDLGATGIAMELTGGVPVDLALNDGLQVLAAPPLPKAPEPPAAEPTVPETDADQPKPVADAAEQATDGPAETRPAATVPTAEEPADKSPEATSVLSETPALAGPGPVSPPDAAAEKAPTPRADPTFSTRRRGDPAPGLSAERIAPLHRKPRLTAAPPPPPRATAADEPVVATPTPTPSPKPPSPPPATASSDPANDADGIDRPETQKPQHPSPATPPKVAPDAAAAAPPSAPEPGVQDRAERAARLSPLLAIKDADTPGSDSTSKPKLAGPPKVAPHSRIADLIAKRSAEPDPLAEAARQEEAQALSLPGLAREVAAKPAGPRLGTGLVLTLVLLAGLMGLGIWSMLGSGSDATLDQVATTAPTERPTSTTEAEALLRQPDMIVAPEPETEIADAAEAGRDTPSAVEPDIAAAAPLPETPAQPVPDTDESDLAALLPSASDTQDAPGGAPIESLVTPPLPLPGATPEEIAEADGERVEESGSDPLVAENAPEEAPLEQFSARGADDPAPTQPSAPTEPADPAIVIAETDPAVTSPETTALPSAIPPGDAFARLTAPAPTPAEAETAPVDTAALDADVAPAEAPVADEITDPATAPSSEATAAEAEIELVAATTDGALAPGGYSVILGRPDLMPTRRPIEVAPIDAAFSPEEVARREVLSRVRPVRRPTDLIPTPDAEASPPDAGIEAEPEADAAPIVDDGFDAETRAILSRTRPQPRPPEVEAAAQQTAQRIAEADAEAARIAAEAAEAVEAARRAAEAEAEAAVQAASQAAAASLASTAQAAAAQTGPVSPLAIAQAERPRLRPQAVEREAARVVERRREQASAAPAPAAPAARQADSGRQQVRSAGGDVARAATERNVIRLNQVNLIGVYGRPSARRALVRLSNGRYVKVEVGDRLDRGRVTAIGESELSYQRGNRNIVLRLPRA